ncbi:MAG: dihydroorotate dehydrogenase [Thermoleophilaceae bacterium]|nr:dihydroorotate dehydrogenase [Thermoleophilaceae bacterium]
MPGRTRARRRPARDRALRGGGALTGGADSSLGGPGETASRNGRLPAGLPPVDLGGVHLAGPVLNGSGTFDAIAAWRAFGDELVERFPFHAFVSKTITLAPRAGNPPPRLWETAAGLLNSIGLPNKGLEGFLAEDLPILARLPVPLVVSVMGFDRSELAELVAGVGARPEVALVELNFSCPNVKTGLEMGAEPSEAARAVANVRSLSDAPLIVKLSPTAAEPAAVAAAAAGAGADAVSLINTLSGTALDPRTRRPWLGGGGGGLSGPAVRSVALGQVAAVAQGVSVPVIGMGGVASGAHAADLLAAGATAVAVGTESFRDPRAGGRISEELAELLAQSGFSSRPDPAPRQPLHAKSPANRL